MLKSTSSSILLRNYSGEPRNRRNWRLEDGIILLNYFPQIWNSFSYEDIQINCAWNHCYKKCDYVFLEGYVHVGLWSKPKPQPELALYQWQH